MSFISKLTLKNFLSFKKEQEFTFDSTINIICGKNGSGKSNIYTAFCHIFTDVYDKQCISERACTIFDSGKYDHEACITVEVIGKLEEIDNNNICVVRKIITRYKQQLYLNEQPISREDLTLALEALGFQSINKYLILRHGEVISEKDFYENGLFKVLIKFFKIGETKVWDSKCKDSLEICKEKQTSLMNTIRPKKQLYSSFKEKIDDYDRSSSLNVLKNAIDKKIKLAERTDSAENVKRLTSMLEYFEGKHNQLSEDKDNLAKSSGQINQQISECHFQMNGVRDKISRNNTEISSKNAELEQIRTKFNEVKIELSEITSKKSGIRKQITEVSNELSTAQEEYGILQSEVDQTMASEKEELSQRMSSLSKDLEKKKELKMLIQSGSSQERIQQIDNEIEKFKELLNGEEVNINSLNNRHSQMESNIQDTKTKIEDYKVKISHNDNMVKSVKTKIEELSLEKNTILTGIDRMKELLQDGISYMPPSEEYYSKERRCGLRAIEEYFNYKNLHDTKGTNYSQHAETYYGVLCDIFECNDELAKKCVQLAVSKSTLLGIVIGKIEETITIKKILEQVESKEKINLYPLESYKNFGIKRIDEPNVKPLIDVLSFDEKFKNLMIATFGSWYIVDNLRTARKVSMEHNINCITHDFSVFRKNGRISCGVISSPPNVIENRRKFLQDQEKYIKKLAETEELHNNIIVENRKVDEILEQITLIQKELKTIQDQKSTFESDLSLNVAKLSDLERSILYVDKDIKNATKKVDEINLKIGTLTDIRNTRMDEHEKKELFKEIDDLEKQYKLYSDQINSLIKRDENLLKISEVGEQIEFLTKEHEKFTKMLDDVTDETPLNDLKNQLEQQMTDKEKDIKILHDNGKKLNSNVNELEVKYRELNYEKETLRSSLNVIYGKIDTCLRKIKDLNEELDKYNENNGKYQLTVQEEQAFSEYINLSIEDLKIELEKINSRLKSISLLNSEDIEETREHINNFNAIVDNSISVSDQLELLSDTIGILSSGKDREFIEGAKFIFAHVGTLFRRFFPDGEINLVLTPKKSVDLNRLTIKDMKGIKISVKTSESGGFIECGFSGGQMNVISLCFIIACHNHFSCPFMCFDEIEANLDAVFKTTFAKLVKDLSYKNQIFLTTFREETMKIGGTFYEIKTTDEGSIAERIDKERALQLIER